MNKLFAVVVLMWSGCVFSADNLGLTVEKFNNKFNTELSAAADTFGFNLSKTIKVKKGEVASVAQIRLNDSNAMVVTADNDSKVVKEISTIFIPEDNAQLAAMSSLYIDAALMKIFSPEIPVKNRGKIISELMQEATNSSEQKSQYVAKKVTYTVMGTSIMGLWFIVSPN